MEKIESNIGELVLKYSQVSLCLIDKRGKVIFSNKYATKFLKQPKDKILGRHIHDIVHGGNKTNHSRANCPLARPLDDLTPILRAPDIFYDVNGEGYWAEFSCYPISEKGKFKAMLLSFLDATVSMRSHQALLEHQAKFKAVFVEALYPKLILDGTGEVLEANQAARNIFGDEIINTMFFNCFTAQSQKKVNDFWKHFMKEGNFEERIEVTVNCPDLVKKKYVFNFSGTRDIQPNMHLLTLVDVTKAYYEQEARNQFIAIASHELKTPLAVIKAYSELLERKYREDERAVQYVTKIQEKVDVLTRLINAMVDETKLGAGKLEFNNRQVDVYTFIQDSVDELQKAHKHNRLVIEGTAKVRAVFDPERIYQVLANLVSNAIKYSGKGKDVVIKVSKDNDNVVVGVQDMGPGVSKKEQSQLFKAFYRSPITIKKKYPGLGLGLFISKQIVNHYEGEMWIESKRGKGSTFFFTLPRS